MWRRNALLFILVSGALATVCAAAVHEMTAAELADRVKAHINERMYETCKAVVLRHQAGAVYRGYAEFLNGIQIDIEVMAAENLIEYRFLKRPQSPPTTTPRSLSDLQMIVARQDAEIARLRALCRQAGIDPNAPLPQVATPQTADANDLRLAPAQDAPMIVREDLETPPEDDPIFTWQVYHNILKGMSYPRVVDMLGHEGDLISSSDFDGAVNDVFVWANADDSHICVVFRNGKVLVRTQYALPDTGPSAQPQPLQAP